MVGTEAGMGDMKVGMMGAMEAGMEEVTMKFIMRCIMRVMILTAATLGMGTGTGTGTKCAFRHKAMMMDGADDLWCVPDVRTRICNQAINIRNFYHHEISLDGWLRK